MITDTETLQIEEVREALALVKGKLTPVEIRKIALKINKHHATIMKYLEGDIANDEFALKLLRVSNDFISLRNDFEDKWNKVEA